MPRLNDDQDEQEHLLQTAVMMLRMVSDAYRAHCSVEGGGSGADFIQCIDDLMPTVDCVLFRARDVKPPRL